MKTPIELIEEERKRQQEVEGWTLEHDDQHTDESLAMAAALYASPRDDLAKPVQDAGSTYFCDPWPWWCMTEPDRGNPQRVRCWDKRKKHDRMRRLQIAGALIVAEMERLQRTNKLCRECGTELNHVGGCENDDCSFPPF